MCYLVSPPHVTIYPRDATAKIFDNFTFVCYATGLGESFSYEWKYNVSTISTSNSLTISPILPQHQGQYKCTITLTYSNFTSKADGFATLNLNGNFKYIHAIVLLSYMYITC